MLAGVVLSIGSSTFIVGNMVAGYSVTYRRAYRVGDRVKIGEHVGISLKTIGDVLGHRTLESTAVYLRLAVEDLRDVALDLPAGLDRHETEVAS